MVGNSNSKIDFVVKKAKRSPRRRMRRGALLLDLFLATLIFAAAMVVLANQGTRSLDLASRASQERIAWIQAESKMAELSAQPITIGKKTSEVSVFGATLSIEVDCQEQTTKGLYLVRIQIQDASRLTGRRNTSQAMPLVVMERYIYQSQRGRS